MEAANYGWCHWFSGLQEGTHTSHACSSSDSTAAKLELARPMTTFPQRVEALVGERSVRAFARDCGVTDSAVRKYIAGESEPSRERLVKMADAAGVSVEWLATGRGPKIHGGQNQPASQSAESPDLPSTADIDGRFHEPEPPPASFVHRALPGRPPRRVYREGPAHPEIVKKLQVREARPVNWFTIPLYQTNPAGAAMGVRRWRRETLEGEYDGDLRNLKSARIRDYSMKPHLFDQDEAFIDASPAGRVVDDDLFGFRHGHEVLVRRLERLSPDRIRVISTNPDYVDYEVILPDGATQTADFEVLGRVVSALGPWRPTAPPDESP